MNDNPWVKPGKGAVRVTWPVEYWIDHTGRKIWTGGSWWGERWFMPGPNALVYVLQAALNDKVDLKKAVRCAEAAGLFRKARGGRKARKARRNAALRAAQKRR